MSLVSTLTQSRFKKRGIALGAICIGLIAVIALTPASGAYLFDAREGHADITTKTFGLSIADGNAAFNFDFDDLAPGESRTENFVVQNTGTAAGTLSFYSAGMTVSGGASPDLGLLDYHLDGFGSIIPTANQPEWITLGTLQGGETRTFTLSAGLDAGAGNEWQDVSIVNTVGLTLMQVH